MCCLVASEPDSESLLTAVEAIPAGGLGNVMFESLVDRGRVGQTMLPVLHSSGMFPLMHCSEGKQFTISVDLVSISAIVYLDLMSGLI